MALVPGWYPQEDGRERFWDGTDWTDAVREPAAEPSAGDGETPTDSARSAPLGCDRGKDFGDVR
jgi:hypothetical protein